MRSQRFEEFRDVLNAFVVLGNIQDDGRLRTIFDHGSIAFVRLHHQEVGPAAISVSDKALFFEPSIALILIFQPIPGIRKAR